MRRVPVSGLVSAEELRAIVDLGGANGVSAGLRIVVAAGLASLKGDGAAAADLITSQVRALTETADRLERIAGHLLPSGARWAALPAAMPAPAALEPGAVLACPGGVVLAGLAGALVLDLAEGENLVLLTAEREVKAPIDVAGLAELAAVLPAAVVGMTQAPGAPRQLPGGLKISRQQSGAVRLELGAVAVDCGIRSLLCFAAELLSLLARRVQAGAAVRLQLEAALQEVAHG